MPADAAAGVLIEQPHLRPERRALSIPDPIPRRADSGRQPRLQQRPRDLQECSHHGDNLTLIFYFMIWCTILLYGRKEPFMLR